MLGFGFMLGIVEDKIQNIIANKQLNNSTKDKIVNELQDIKNTLYSHIQGELLYDVEIHIDPESSFRSKVYYEFNDVRQLKRESDFVIIMCIDRTIYFRTSDVNYINMEIHKDKEEQT